jgi:Tat protein secretion system quality control protein TatD with DNase activity
MFQGNYRGKQAHAPDLEAVLQRSEERGVETMIITGTSLEESKDALEMAERYGALFLLLIPMYADSEYAQSCTQRSGVIRLPQKRSPNAARTNTLKNWKE